MGLIYNGDDIGDAIREGDEAQRAGFVSAQDRHTELLRRELEAERQVRKDCEALLAKYARLIGEQKDTIRRLKTCEGIRRSLSHMDASLVTPSECKWVVLGAAGLVGRLVNQGWEDLSQASKALDDVCDALDETFADAEDGGPAIGVAGYFSRGDE